MVFQPRVAVPPDVGGVAVSPGAFPKRPPSMGIAGRSDRTLPACAPLEYIDVTLPRPDSAEGDDLTAMFLGDVGDSNRLSMDI